MRVNHGRIDVAMPQQFLDRPDVLASFRQMGRERMPQCMRSKGLGNVSSGRRALIAIPSVPSYK